MPRNPVDAIIAYHERTKHHPRRMAPSLGYLDWDTQPDPFRRYLGAELVALDLPGADATPSYDALFGRDLSAPSTAVTSESLSDLLFHSMALSAWKSAGGSRWALRVNPSSGNLHPTEAYVVGGPLAALAHYAPREHSLEVRCAGSDTSGMAIGLASVHWREAWKYGERAFRYCQHDVGHAIACIALAARMHGWRAAVDDALSDAALAELLGIAGQTGAEAEHPDTLVRVLGRRSSAGHGPPAGSPNSLSPAHQPWPAIEDAAAACAKPTTDEPAAPTLPLLATAGPDREASAREVIRGRRSAVGMDGESAIERDAFYGLLRRLMPSTSNPVWACWPYAPAVHLVVFVHRVHGLAPGLYALPRTAEGDGILRGSLRADFAWSRPDGRPADLPLWLLSHGDVTRQAQSLSCGQEIAADGAFAVAMLAEFEPRIRSMGAWFYRRQFWESGMIGQVLYLEAEAAGMRGTGIGCFYDDPTHHLLGIERSDLQSLYHFTVGGAIDDPRIETLPAYEHLHRRS